VLYLAQTTAAVPSLVLPVLPVSGRAAGTQNKITLTAKAAIAEFVDGNAHRLAGWLDLVANGKPMLDKDGNKVYDSQGNMVYEIRPNPEKAFNLFQSVVEYHVPKLARSEISGPNGGAIETTVVDLKGLSDTGASSDANLAWQSCKD
jgi:hypothetical protein